MKSLSLFSDGLRRHLLLAVLFSIVGACLYGWTLKFPMEFDDFMYLKDNPLSTDARSFAYPFEFREFANRAGKMAMDPDLSANFILRPVAYLTFYINHALDGYNPKWWRLVNIVIHVANALLVHALVMTLLAGKVRQGSVLYSSSFFIAAVSGLLFLVHPLAIESVTYIVQRFTSLGTFFYLLGLGLYFAGLQSSSSAASLMLRLSAAGVIVTGMLTKECTFTAPVMAVMLDILVRESGWKKALKNAVPLLLTLPIIPALVMLISWAQNDGVFSFAKAVNLTNLKDEPWSHWHFFLTQLTVIVEYLRLTFWPTGLNLDPEWPLHRAVTEGPVLISMSVIVAVVGLSFAAFRLWRREPRAALIFASVLWFFATVFISSGLVPLPDLKAEHRSYLPSIGIFIAAACVLDSLRRSGFFRWVVPVAAIAMLGALSNATIQRNETWRTQVSLWADTALKSPNKQRVWSNLACAHFDIGERDKAIDCLKRAITVDPEGWRAYVNLTIALNSERRHYEALETIEKLFQLAPNAGRMPDALSARAMALAGVGRTQEAIPVLKSVVQQIPHHRDSQLALGLIYKALGQRDSALHHFQQAARLSKPDGALVAIMKDLQTSSNETGE